MVKPFLQDDELLSNINQGNPNPTDFRLWWLGQSGFLIQWRGNHLLFDPYLSDSLTLKYAQTDKPHIRMTERAVNPMRLNFIDVVTSSHNHTDHLDAATLIPLISVNPDINLVIPEANREFVCDRINCDHEFPVGMNDQLSKKVGDFLFHGIPAAHNDLSRDDNGNCHYMGFIVQFGSWTIYHSGDTLWYPGMEDILSPFAPDLAILPINGNKPERRVAGNLDHQEAPKLAKAIGAKVVIPCHYQMFTFNTADVEDFVTASEQIGQPYQVLQCGEPWSSEVIV